MSVWLDEMWKLDDRRLIIKMTKSAWSLMLLLLARLTGYCDIVDQIEVVHLDSAQIDRYTLVNDLTMSAWLDEIWKLDDCRLILKVVKSSWSPMH